MLPHTNILVIIDELPSKYPYLNSPLIILHTIHDAYLPMQGSHLNLKGFTLYIPAFFSMGHFRTLTMSQVGIHKINALVSTYILHKTV